MTLDEYRLSVLMQVGSTIVLADLKPHAQMLVNMLLVNGYHNNKTPEKIAQKILKSLTSTTK